MRHSFLDFQLMKTSDENVVTVWCHLVYDLTRSASTSVVSWNRTQTNPTQQ